MKEITVLDFLAQKINEDLSIKEGYSAATLWLCTNEERKERCLKMATRMFEDWKNNELAAEEARNMLRADIKVIHVGGPK